MGVDIHVRVIKYDEESRKWKDLPLFRSDKGDIKRVSPYEGRWGELFDILQGKEYVDDTYVNFPSYSIDKGSLDKKLRKTIEQYEVFGCYGFAEINLVEMENYVLKHPKAYDHDADWEEGVQYKENPVKDFFDRIINYIDFADWTFDWARRSYYKIIFFFDC